VGNFVVEPRSPTLKLYELEEFRRRIPTARWARHSGWPFSKN